jgi:hypothetical protein
MEGSKMGEKNATRNIQAKYYAEHYSDSQRWTIGAPFSDYAE